MGLLVSEGRGALFAWAVTGEGSILGSEGRRDQWSQLSNGMRLVEQCTSMAMPNLGLSVSKCNFPLLCLSRHARAGFALVDRVPC